MLAKKDVINDLQAKPQSFGNQFCSLMAELYKRLIEMSTNNSISLNLERSAIPNIPGVFAYHEVRGLYRARKKNFATRPIR